ncbi:MAG: IS701 family transposase [Chloroflexota bacterium]|nr:IS701 family transposase [Chloroflexota bacterium]
MTTPRKSTNPTAQAIDRFCAQFDDLYCRVSERQAFRQYLIGLLLPREHNKTLTVLSSLVPGANTQRLHHFVHDSPWDCDAVNARRLSLWQQHRALGPHPGGVLIVDETGDRKRGHGIELAANQYIGKLGHTANGVVSVTSHWSDGTRHVPLGVRAYRPKSRLPLGQADPRFHTKPELAWELIEEARKAGVPFRVVVADCVYGESPKLEQRLYRAKLKYILALRPNKGTWQLVEDEQHPPAFTPAEAAQRVPIPRSQRTVHTDSHGKELVRYVAELELGPYYGPQKSARLIAATEDPEKLKAENTWYMSTNLSVQQASTPEVYDLYRLRDWIEHYYKPAKHELGWADFQMRKERAIVRHWQLVMLAFTFSLLEGVEPEEIGGTDRERTEESGGKIWSPYSLERYAEAHQELAMPVGAHDPLLAKLVHCTSSNRAGSPA